MPLTPQDFAATQGMGSGLNQVALMVARQRYMQAMQQQRQALLLGQLAMRQHMDAAKEREINAHIGQYGATTEMNKSRASLYDSQKAISDAKLDSANRLGRASRMPVDMSQGPTMEAASQLQAGDLQEQALRSLALSGKANQLFQPHTTPANAVSTDFMGGKTFGPRNTAPGYQYQAEPGGEVYQAPNRPVSPEKRGNIDATLIGGLVKGTIDASDSELYRAATNALARASGNNLSVSGDQSNSEQKSAPQMPKPRYATNGKQRIMTLDGGKTWIPAQ